MTLTACGSGIVVGGGSGTSDTSTTTGGGGGAAGGGAAAGFSNALSLPGGAEMRASFTATPYLNTYTVEFFIKPTAVTNSLRVFSFTNNVNANPIEGHFTAGGNLVLNYLFTGNGCVTPGLSTPTTTVFTSGTKYHVAMTAGASGVKIFVNGVQEVNDAVATQTGCTNWAFVRIGASGSGTGVFTGVLDEFRISDILRYTTGFTPPTTPLTNDANTILLMHWDSATTTIDNTTLSAASIAVMAGVPALIATPFP